MPLKYFKHMKTYDGVLESSFMFFMQVSNACLLKGSSAKQFTLLQTSYFGPEWVEVHIFDPLSLVSFRGILGPSEPNDTLPHPIPTQTMGLKQSWLVGGGSL